MSQLDVPARLLAPAEGRDHGRFLYAGEPLVFHCNFYNYWLQKTLMLDPSLEMASVIQAAAAEAASQTLAAARSSLAEDTAQSRRLLAESTFAELGFGTIDLGQVSASGGRVELPVSHYGLCLRQAIGTDFAAPQTWFDAGFAAAAAAFVADVPADSFVGSVQACQAMGASKGIIELSRGESPVRFAGYANAAHLSAAPPAPYADGNVDEAAVLAALATLDFSGNEEGLIPRFGVMLTRHFAGFYNRVSFEFLRKMGEFGLVEAAEMLLGDTAYRCAFHTFGGIMSSPEWDAVVRPQCKDTNDWVHGMVACVNALGWGVWRVVSLDDSHVKIRIYDDYESCGWLDMYGKAERPVSHLAAGGTAGMMNLIHIANIHDKPKLDLEFYGHIFERQDIFMAEQTASMAMGDPYTEIIARR